MRDDGVAWARTGLVGLGGAGLLLGLLLGPSCGGDTGDAGGGAGTGATSSGGSGGTGNGGTGGGATSAGGASSGGANTGGAMPATGGSTTSCTTATDCTWTEIEQEITARADCMCLLGCPFLLVNRVTAERRAAQHAALCDPNTDAQGDPCPIDECIVPPEPDCVGGECTAPEFP